MDLIKYVGLKVKIILSNGYYYVGKVINADSNSVELLDIKEQNVSLAKEIIFTIQEIKK